MAAESGQRAKWGREAHSILPCRWILGKDATMVKRHKRRTILVIEGEAEGGRQGQIAHRLNKETVAHNDILVKV